MKQQQFDPLIKMFSFSPPFPAKIKQKRQNFLLNLPLFTTIYQKKGQQNFDIIVKNIKLNKYQFGDTILQNYPKNDQLNQNRSFSYIIKGTVMIFVTKPIDNHKQPVFYKKLTTNQYFGERLSFGNDKLYQVKACSPCFILQLDLLTFYNAFSGHFQYAQLRDKVMFLEKIWIFNDIGRINIERILLMSENIKIKKNTILFKQGQIPQYFYIIVAGEIALYENLMQEKVKFVPFCLLSRSEICGLEEIALETAYQYNGIVNSQFIDVLLINKQTYFKYIQPNIPRTEKTISTLYEQKLKLKQKSIKYEKQYKQVCQYSRRRQRQIFSFFIKKFIPPKNQPIIMSPIQLNLKVQLKDKYLREIKLKQIKDQQIKFYNNSRISIITNNNYTKDKKLLINYLTKKQKMHTKLYNSQLNFQRSMSEKSGIIEGIKLEKSSAVKHQKRKLVKSRNRTLSSIE